MNLLALRAPSGLLAIVARIGSSADQNSYQDFSVGPQKLRLSLDIQNLFNSDTPLTIDNNSSDADTDLAPAAIFLPRRAILGFRYSF